MCNENCHLQSPLRQNIENILLLLGILLIFKTIIQCPLILTKTIIVNNFVFLFWLFFGHTRIVGKRELWLRQIVLTNVIFY